MCPSLAVTTDDGADNDAGFMNPQNSGYNSTTRWFNWSINPPSDSVSVLYPCYLAKLGLIAPLLYLYI